MTTQPKHRRDFDPRNEAETFADCTGFITSEWICSDDACPAHRPENHVPQHRK